MSFQRPGGHGHVDLFHQGDGLLLCNNHALIMRDGFDRKRAAFSVLQHLLDLVPVEFEIPDFFGKFSQSIDEANFDLPTGTRTFYQLIFPCLRAGCDEIV